MATKSDGKHLPSHFVAKKSLLIADSYQPFSILGCCIAIP
jgi:hypothetical protein